jgi:hypothetical protein
MEFYSAIKEVTTDTCYNMDESQSNYAKEKKPN